MQDIFLSSSLSLFASLLPSHLCIHNNPSLWSEQIRNSVTSIPLFVSCLSVGGPRWQIQVSLAGRLPSNITFVTTVDEWSMWVEWQVSDRPVSNNYFDCHRYSAVSLWLYKTLISIDFVKFSESNKRDNILFSTAVEKKACTNIRHASNWKSWKGQSCIIRSSCLKRWFS